MQLPKVSAYHGLSNRHIDPVGRVEGIADAAIVEKGAPGEEVVVADGLAVGAVLPVCSSQTEKRQQTHPQELS